jgi:hypothetical protein
LSNVVFPAPRKPLNTVTGNFLAVILFVVTIELYFLNVARHKAIQIFVFQNFFCHGKRLVAALRIHE